jgi:predicted nucleic acid-binding protein
MLVDRDLDHGRAQAIVAQLAAESRTLATTNFVLAELHALALARAGRDTALQAISKLFETRIGIVRIDAAAERRALEILRTYRDKDFSFTDATSFAVMDRLGIREAFTFDHHFRQYGLTVLDPA